MNILQITKSFYPAVSFGGTVTSTYNIAKYLVKRGHDVTVYTTDASNISTNERFLEKYQKIDGVKVFRFRNLAKFYGLFVSPGIIHGLLETISNFDVVHLHEYRTFQNLAFHFLNTTGIPYILSCHGEFAYTEESLDWFFTRRLFEYTFGRKLLNGASKLFALTKFEAAQFFDAGIARDKVAIIPNGVDLQGSINISLSDSFRESFDIGEEKIVLYLGRLHKIKGIDILVKAFALLSNERNNVKLLLAGPDHGFMNYLKKLVGDLNLEDKVLFTGSLSRKQVLAAYLASTVVVYPSIQEALGIVPLEAAMMGKAVIVSDVPTMDFVKKGSFGLTVKYGNVNQLKVALEMILDNPEMSRELGKKGREFVNQNYSWESIVKMIENEYYQVAGQLARKVL